MSRVRGDCEDSRGECDSQESANRQYGCPHVSGNLGSSLLSERGPVSDRSGNPSDSGAGHLVAFDQQKNLPQHKMTSSTPAASSTFVASAYSCSPSSVSTEGRRTGLGGWVRSVSPPPSWARCFSVGTCGSKALPFRGLPRARFRRFSAAIRLFCSPSVQPRVTCSLLAARVEVKQDGDS
jgi:hypothetical protein